MYLDVHCRLCSLAMYLVSCKPSACCYMSSSLTLHGHKMVPTASSIIVSKIGREVRKLKEPFEALWVHWIPGKPWLWSVPPKEIPFYIIVHCYPPPRFVLYYYKSKLEICSLKINERPRTDAAMITLDQLTVIFWVVGNSTLEEFDS